MKKININEDIDVVTALEILGASGIANSFAAEPAGKKLNATIPLRLWVKTAYRNTNDA